MNTFKVRHGDNLRHLLRLCSGPTESWSSVEPEVGIEPTTYPLPGGTSPAHHSLYQHRQFGQLSQRAV